MQRLPHLVSEKWADHMHTRRPQDHVAGPPTHAPAGGAKIGFLRMKKVKSQKGRSASLVGWMSGTNPSTSTHRPLSFLSSTYPLESFAPLSFSSGIRSAGVRRLLVAFGTIRSRRCLAGGLERPWGQAQQNRKKAWGLAFCPLSRLCVGR